MKKIYVNPLTMVVNVEVQSALMQMSVSSQEINEKNAGFVKGNSSSSRSSYSVWNDDWSGE